MIPSKNGFLPMDFSIEKQPSRTYTIHISENNIGGYCDELEAVKQAVYKILNTERYWYWIYSWNYGIELSDLFGEPITYVCPELERRITEALTQDERITGVDAFAFNTGMKGQVLVSFTVHSIFGEIKTQKAVDY